MSVGTRATAQRACWLVLVLLAWWPSPAQSQPAGHRSTVIFQDDFARADAEAAGPQWFEFLHRLPYGGQWTASAGETAWSVRGKLLRFEAVGTSSYVGDFVMSRTALPIENTRLEFDLRAQVQTMQGYVGPGFFWVTDQHQVDRLGWTVWYNWENRCQRGYAIEAGGRPQYVDDMVLGVNTGAFAHHAITIRRGELAWQVEQNAPVVRKLAASVTGQRRHLAITSRLYDQGAKQVIEVRNLKVTDLGTP